MFLNLLFIISHIRSSYVLAIYIIFCIDGDLEPARWIRPNACFISYPDKLGDIIDILG